MPRLVAAHTRPPPKRTRPIVVESSSEPPTRSAIVNWPVFGLASRNTPAPAYAVPPVFASPEENHSEPSAARVRSPEDRRRELVADRLPVPAAGGGAPHAAVRGGRVDVAGAVGGDPGDAPGDVTAAAAGVGVVVAVARVVGVVGHLGDVGPGAAGRRAGRSAACRPRCRHPRRRRPARCGPRRTGRPGSWPPWTPCRPRPGRRPAIIMYFSTASCGIALTLASAAFSRSRSDSDLEALGAPVHAAPRKRVEMVRATSVPRRRNVTWKRLCSCDPTLGLGESSRLLPLRLEVAVCK